MNLGQLKYAKGSMRRRKRLGAGRGSGRGGTCGRGTKGLLSRSGGRVHPWFEGGQMPLQRRLPKRGFKKRNPMVYQVVNLKDLERMEPGSLIDAAALAARGLVRDPGKPVKLLGDGEVKGAYSLKVTAASRGAIDKIQAAGGSVEVTVGPKRPKAPQRPKAPPAGAERAGKPDAEASAKKAGVKAGAEGKEPEAGATKAEPKAGAVDVKADAGPEQQPADGGDSEEPSSDGSEDKK